MYSFVGGGLPEHVRTVFIEPWQNNTPYAILASDVQQALQTGLPRNLGVRLSSQTVADAIVRGRLLTYEEVTTNVSPDVTPSGQVQPLQQRVQITFEAEIYDVKEDKVLWKGSNVAAIGNFDPREGVEVGRRKAVEEVVQKLVQGAQSQW